MTDLSLIAKNGAGFTVLFKFIQPQVTYPVAAVIGFGSGAVLTYTTEEVATYLANAMLGVAGGGAVALGMDASRRTQLLSMLGGGAAGYALQYIPPE